jgi:hypothetical protein
VDVHTIPSSPSAGLTFNFVVGSNNWCLHNYINLLFMVQLQMQYSIVVANLATVTAKSVIMGQLCGSAMLVILLV